ncbi:hypothetical protein I203_107454 [Kwoniella mangroviensis CBS 8507]|uniref:hypothetical protein n=1 Tax=Kwoniella mangroviensis CBS 8507 TaxID=1296122 RepID=UPI00080CF91C|nr:uncharacterized protein I203_02207 [Kwoniella mangroviensis CBS 8507]OCF68816.1 hypothetical protein I203_02207 [Kwoniella mangroviensis CBS 8507]
MLKNSLSILFALLLTVQLISATAINRWDEEMPCKTNAECLKKGLPLRKPSPVVKRGALHPRQSNTVSSTYRISVIRGQGVVGFLDRTPNANGQYTMSQDASQRIIVGEPSLSPGELKISNYVSNNGLSYVYLAAQIGPNSGGSILSASSYNYAVITASTSSFDSTSGPATPPNPSYTLYGVATGSTSPLETNTWYQTAAGSQNLFTNWVNSDGTTLSRPQIMYDTVNANFVITGCATCYQAQFPNNNAYAVSLARAKVTT